MLNRARAVRDTFALSRGGLTVIASYVATPVVSSDRINQARDERIRRARAAGRDRSWNYHDCGPGTLCPPQAA